MVYYGHSGIPGRVIPMEAQAFGAGFFFFCFVCTNGNMKQILSISQGTGQSTLGPAQER